MTHIFICFESKKPERIWSAYFTNKLKYSNRLFETVCNVIQLKGLELYQIQNINKLAKFMLSNAKTSLVTHMHLVFRHF